MQSLFTNLVKTLHLELLKKQGFVKKGLTFYRHRGDGVHVINFQKSSGNRAESLRFYINIGIYVPRFSEYLGKDILEFPKESECHLRWRLEDITGSLNTHYEMSPDSELFDVLYNELTKCLEYLDTLARESEIINAMIKKSGIDYDLFQILLAKGDERRALHCYDVVAKRFGEEQRWQIISKRYKEIAALYSLNLIQPEPRD